MVLLVFALTQEHGQRWGAVILNNCFLWQKKKKKPMEIWAKNTNISFPFLFLPNFLPQGKGTAQCFNYCWLCFQWSTLSSSLGSWGSGQDTQSTFPLLHILISLIN